MGSIKKTYKNKEDAKIFNDMYPHWLKLMAEYIATNDEHVLKIDLILLCESYGWSLEDLLDYQETIKQLLLSSKPNNITRVGNN